MHESWAAGVVEGSVGVDPDMHPATSRRTAARDAARHEFFTSPRSCGARINLATATFQAWDEKRFIAADRLLSVGRNPQPASESQLMRKLPVFGVALLALVAFAMPAAAEEEAASDEQRWNFEAYLQEAHSWGQITVSVGPDSVEFVWSGLTLGEQASADLRELADGALSGEKDGEVDETELDDFTFALSALFESQFGKVANHRAFSGFLLIDQAEAQDVKVTNVGAEHLAGSVDQTDPIVVEVALAIDFPNIDDYKDVHTVRFDLGSHFIEEGHEEEAQRLAGDLTLAIQGAEGWTIDAASVQPACAAESLEEGALVFSGEDVSCFTGRDGVLLTFAINGEGKREASFLPGLELLGLAAALGVGLVLRRRL